MVDGKRQLFFEKGGLMKLKYLAAFLMLLAIGCTQQPASESPAPADSGGGTPAATDSSDAGQTVERETETQLASVSFDVTGMQ